MPQVVHNQQMQPHYYQSLSGALLTPFAGQLGNQLGEGLGYMGRHLLFGNTPQEDLLLAEAGGKNLQNDAVARSAYDRWLMENQEKSEAEKLAAAKRLGIRDVGDSTNDAALYLDRNSAALGRAFTTGTAENGMPIQDSPGVAGGYAPTQPPAPQKGLAPASPQDLFKLPGVGEQAEELAGMAQQEGAGTGGIPGSVVKTPGGGMAPSPETQASAAAQQDKAPLPGSSIPTAPEQRAKDKMIEAAQNPLPPPQFTPGQKLQGQALINQIGSRLSANRALAMGQYTPESAAQMAGLFNSTDEQVRKLGDLTASAMGTGPNTVGLRDVMNASSFQIKNNPTLYATIKDAGTRAAIDKQAAEYAARNYNNVELAQLANFGKAFPQDMPTYQSYLASLKVFDQLHDGSVDRYIKMNADKRANRQMDWQEAIQPAIQSEAMSAAQIKAVTAKHSEEAIQLTMDSERQRLFQSGKMFPILRDHAVLNNLSAQATMNTLALDENLKAIEFVGTQEQRTLIAKMQAYEKVKMTESAAIDKIAESNGFMVPGPQQKVLQEQIKIHQDALRGANAALQSLAMPGQQLGLDGRPIPAPGALIEDLRTRYGLEMKDILGKAYKAAQDNPDPTKADFNAPGYYAHRTSLVSWKPDGTLVNMLPRDPSARGWAVTLAKHTGPDGKKMDQAQFFATPVPAPDKGMIPFSQYIQKPEERARVYQLYSDWVDTGRTK